MLATNTDCRFLVRNPRTCTFIVVAITLLCLPGLADEMGRPWQGEPGVRESLAQIMARQGQTSTQTAAVVHPLKPRLAQGPAQPRQNPDSPLSSQWPLTGAGASPAPPALLPRTPQALGTSFLAVQLSDTPGFVPPDSMGDVGPSQLVVCVNGRIRSFDRAGAADGALDADTDTFFASVLHGSSTSDPRVRFDRLSGRWFITMITVNTPNFVLVAVSSGPTLASASSFTFFSFQADPSNFGDYDTLGVDANALYIGVNVFGTRSLKNTTGFVVNKANLLAGTLTVTTFANLIVSVGHPSKTDGPFTPQGVNNDDPNATEGYFIGVDETTAGTLVLRRISNPGGTPSISGNILITVPATTTPTSAVSVPALGSSQKLDALDGRLFATRMHQGTLWTAHNLFVDASGNANISGGRVGSRWYQMANLTGTPTLVQSGTLFDPAASSPRNFWIPSCAMSGQGHMALGCSVAGNTENAEIAIAGRLASDPLGSIQAPTTAVTTTSTYNIGSQNGVYRWGDFSVTSVDPNDDMTFWTVQEYCNANNSWGVRVIKLLAPPPALPIACSPSTLTQGVANVSVVLTGSTASGSGFFDPESGFPNHLSATVNGGGVTLNNVVYDSPTHVTLNLTVAANAAAGARTITVTNPDGQSATSISGLLTIGTGSNLPPTLAALSNRTVAVGMTLSVTNVAGDPDGDLLTFSLGTATAPNATINATNGIFSWSPTQSQIGSNFFTVVVTDNGIPPLSATQGFSVTVLPSNSPPTLAFIADRSVYAQTTLLVTNSATDPDAPPQALTFSLDPGAPAGASINPTNGILAWTPAVFQIGLTNLTVRVTDNGLPNLSDARTFAVNVLAGPTLLVPGVSNNLVLLTWTAISETTYRVQYKSNLLDNTWTDLSPDIIATGTTASTTQTNLNPWAFYRVLVVP